MGGSEERSPPTANDVRNLFVSRYGDFKEEKKETLAKKFLKWKVIIF
jgi:hypothetical protein